MNLANHNPIPGATAGVRFRTALVRVHVVADLRGISSEQVLDMADGEFQWVWNVCPSEGRRELRFWCGEIHNPAAVAGLTLDEVIRLILPNAADKRGFTSSELADFLRVQRGTMLGLYAELGAVRTAGERGNPVFIPRPAVDRFLRRRWLFAGVPVN